MKPQIARGSEIPLNIVGGNTYGRYKKISDARTYNMIESDGALVPFPGFEMVARITNLPGRAIYVSQRWNRMIAVFGNTVWGIEPHLPNGVLPFFFIGNIGSFTGDVFIAENIASQIGICDGEEVYIYNWKTPSNPALIAATLPVDPATDVTILPAYICYQDGYFVVGNSQSANWFLSAVNNGLSWNWGAGGTAVFASLQTKSNNFVAAIRMPSRGDLLAVIGTNIVEFWQNVGGAIFPYSKNTSVNIDYGCLNAATFAAMDSYIAWLGTNEQSGPVIMVSQGADITPLSTDGIDYQLAQLNNPSASYGFFWKECGHLFYQLTFYDPSDNFSLVYDFNTKKFFSPSDENLNYHPASRIAFFDDSYYFVSINDGNIYRTSSQLTTYNYSPPGEPNTLEYEIPRERIIPPIRSIDASRSVANSLTFTVEQGNDKFYKGTQLYLIAEENGTVLAEENNIPMGSERTVNPYVPRIDLALSKDGSMTFGNNVSKFLNSLGNRQNRLIFWNLGSYNDLSIRLRFITKSHISVFDGILNTYS